MEPTNKFNHAISSFQCDFSLAKEGDGYRSLSQLDALIAKKDEKIMRDIELLEELEFLLRYGKAEILLNDGQKFEEWIQKHDEDIRKKAREEAVTEFADDIRSYADRKWSPINEDDVLSLSEDRLSDMVDKLLGGHGPRLSEGRDEICNDERE